MISDSLRLSSLHTNRWVKVARSPMASRSKRRFAEPTATIGSLAVPLVLLSGLAAMGAEKRASSSQLQAPTHRQVRVIEPKVDGETLKLHTIATTADGHLLAAVGGQSMQYVMKDSGYETKFVEEPGLVLLLDSEGEILKKWELEITPSALAVAPDGTIYIGGSGKIARLGDDGSVAVTVDSPHVGDVKELRKKTIESIRESFALNREMFDDQIDTLRENIDKIESKDEGDRSQLEQAQLKAFESQLEMLESYTGSQEDGDEPVVDDAQLEMAVMRGMSVTSMAASDKDVFVCASDPGQGGYSIWRLGRDLDKDSSELIMEGLRGCCGQMDIQCCGENLLVSENAKFRVGIYDRHGRNQGSFGRRDRTSRKGFGGCCNPMNSMAMKDGSILVAESSIGHIKRFDTDGNLVSYIGKAAIGAGCKHCALGYDEKNDLYYMMYSDKNSICVLANNEKTPLTLAEKQRGQRQAEFLAKAAGQWSLKQDGEEESESGGWIASLFGGGRGGSSQHPIASMKLSVDGSAKILEGMYQAYGDKSQLEILDPSDPDSDAVDFALTIDQMRFVEGTWKFDDADTATLTFQGQSPVTLVRESPDAGESSCAGQDCTNQECPNKDCPKTKASDAVVAVKATESEVAEYEAMMAEYEASMAEEEMGEDDNDSLYVDYDFEAQMPKPKFEYKVISKDKLGRKLETKLNKLGADGWELCGRFGKELVFKRMSGFEMVKAPKE